MRALTLVDVLRIQDFVFASNRLRDVAGGSDLVHKAVERERIQSLAERGRVVFAAGGNALLDFDDLPAAKAFAARYSRWLIDDFPGLDVEVAHEKYGEGHWLDALHRAGACLRARKLSRRPSSPLLGLSVTAECAETRGVASVVERDRDSGEERAISRGIAARRGGDDDGRWKALLPEGGAAWNGFELAFPRELDMLGRTQNDVSLIGVVHVDGNGVGQAIEDWLSKAAETRSSEEQLRDDYGALSRELDALGEGALRSAVARVGRSLRVGRDGDVCLWSRVAGRGFALRAVAAERKVYLPLRPIILGGDDITFVCDGRIALDLAHAVLEHLATHPVAMLGRTIGAAAGVAIVKAHSPFARAYERAEELCARAKAELKRRQDAGERDARERPWILDWHIGYAGSLEPVDSLRRRQYRTGDWVLHCRPYLVGDAATQLSFAWLEDALLGPGDGASGGLHGPFWSRKRSKAKALAELARGGPSAVSRALDAWAVTAGVGELPGGLGKSGFVGKRTPLLDAIELLDVHHSLG